MKEPVKNTIIGVFVAIVCIIIYFLLMNKPPAEISLYEIPNDNAENILVTEPTTQEEFKSPMVEIEEDLEYITYVSRYMDELSKLTTKFRKNITGMNLQDEESKKKVVKSIESINKFLPKFNMFPPEKYENQHMIILKDIKKMGEGYTELAEFIKKVNTLSDEEFVDTEMRIRIKINDATKNILENTKIMVEIHESDNTLK